jgi:hypothetical protein
VDKLSAFRRPGDFRGVKNDPPVTAFQRLILFYSAFEIHGITPVFFSLPDFHLSPEALYYSSKMGNEQIEK